MIQLNQDQLIALEGLMSKTSMDELVDAIVKSKRDCEIKVLIERLRTFLELQAAIDKACDALAETTGEP